MAFLIFSFATQAASRFLKRFQAAYWFTNRQPETLFRRVRQHLRRVLPRGFGDSFAAEHAGDFVHAGGIVQHADFADGLLALAVLGDLPMVFAAGGNLRQVGDGEHLVLFAQRALAAADLAGDAVVAVYVFQNFVCRLQQLGGVGKAVVALV